MDTNTQSGRPSLLRQILGAIGGAAVALLLYQAYSVSAPAITAWLMVPQSQIDAKHPGDVRVNGETDAYTYDRIAAKAEEIYRRFAAEPAPRAAVFPQGIEVTQPLPQRSSASALSTEQTEEGAAVREQIAAPPPEGSSSSQDFAPPPVPLPPPQTQTPIVASLAGSELPQSGVGTAAAAIMALGATAMARKRRAK